MSLQAAPVVTYNQRAGAGARRGASVQLSGTGAARRVCAAVGDRRGASVQRPANGGPVALDLLLLLLLFNAVMCSLTR